MYAFSSGKEFFKGEWDVWYLKKIDFSNSGLKNEVNSADYKCI